MLDISYLFNNNTLKCIIAKYSISTRNKCVYLFEASETTITIWRHFPETLADNYSMMQILKKLNYWKILE